jgi:hypothetical protein
MLGYLPRRSLARIWSVVPCVAEDDGLQHLVSFRHDQRGFAPWVHATEPSGVKERLAQLRCLYTALARIEEVYRVISFW